MEFSESQPEDIIVVYSGTPLCSSVACGKGVEEGQRAVLFECEGENCQGHLFHWDCVSEELRAIAEAHQRSLRAMMN